MYPHLFVAGTFDGMHAGHRAILTQAFAQGKKVIVGLTSDQFVQKFKIFNFQFSMKISNFKFQIGKYKDRKNALEAWLERQNKHATIVPIDDPYEPAASMKDLDALIVTRENRKTGERINVLRQGATLPCLTLIDVPMVEAQDGKPVSSTRMRNGEIDGDGRLVMPESMRETLGKPLGRVLTATEVDRLLRSHPARQGETFRVTVGDIATKTFLDAGITPALAIIDGKVGRKPFHETVDRLQPRRVRPFEAKAVKSGPGFISREAVETIEHCLSCHVSRLTSHVLLIDGEEDLLVLPAVIHAPIGSVVYYGQPNEGLVEVVVTKAKKQQALALLSQFLY